LPLGDIPLPSHFVRWKWDADDLSCLCPFYPAVWNICLYKKGTIDVYASDFIFNFALKGIDEISNSL